MNYKKITILLHIFLLLLNSVGLLYTIAESEPNSNINYITISTNNHEIPNYGVYDNSPFPLELQIIYPNNLKAGSIVHQADDIPIGASYDPSIGFFSWKPNCTQDGIYTIKFFAENNLGIKSQIMTIKIIVNNGC